MKKRKNEQQQQQNAKRSFTSTIRREEFCDGNSQCAVFEFESFKRYANQTREKVGQWKFGNGLPLKHRAMKIREHFKAKFSF